MEEEILGADLVEHGLGSDEAVDNENLSHVISIRPATPTSVNR